MENSGPSTSRKRQRSGETEPEPESESDLNDYQLLSLEENFNFSDTLVALRMMRAQFPRIEKVQCFFSDFFLHYFDNNEWIGEIVHKLF